MVAALRRALWLEAHGHQGEPWIIATFSVRAGLVDRGLAEPYQVVPGRGPVNYRITDAGRALVAQAVAA
jgi:hypothetical protein